MLLQIFLAEIRKIAALDDGIEPGRMTENEPHPVETIDTGTPPPVKETEAKEPSESIFEKAPETTQPSASEASPVGPAGSLGSLGVRQSLEERLESADGRRSIRSVLTHLRQRDEETVGLRRAFTRALLRAHRNTSGPSPTPRRDLRDLLYHKEPFAEVSRT